ncbi:unnamed protein product [Mytilus edulis]|uniref:Uncharacterized protein n=1 Tax=Mytilus edulis TaxID=6550 RepID=A0A8S3V162_MYTED|nr:unnamed protein product [Mytilus edulis]
MFYDQVHINNQKGLPAIVKYLKTAMNLYPANESKDYTNFHEHRSYGGPRRDDYSNRQPFVQPQHAPYQQKFNNFEMDRPPPNHVLDVSQPPWTPPPNHLLPKKLKKVRRNSGGICVFAKSSIAKGIKKLPKNHPDILWIKLDSLFFKFDKDVYIATVYISPENSSVNVSGIEPIYIQLLADTVKYSSLGHIMPQGDFNAYTNTKPDYVTFDASKKTNLEDSHYDDDKIMSRNILDPKLINNSGKILLSLCQESCLRIFNGRTVGDLHGKYTCITYNGCSVVD